MGLPIIQNDVIDNEQLGLIVRTMISDEGYDASEFLVRLQECAYNEEVGEHFLEFLNTVYQATQSEYDDAESDKGDSSDSDSITSFELDNDAFHDGGYPNELWGDEDFDGYSHDMDNPGIWHSEVYGANQADSQEVSDEEELPRHSESMMYRRGNIEARQSGAVEYQ